MPVDVAVEEPDTGIVGNKADDEIALGGEHESISSRRGGRESRVVVGIVRDGVAVQIVVEGGAVRRRPIDNLEVVPVEMEGVRAGIAVIENNLDDVVMLQDDGMREVAVDLRIGRHVAGRQHGEQGRYLGRGIGDIIQEGIAVPVQQVPHIHRYVDLVVRVWIQR